jgi:hypothetical protein
LLRSVDRILLIESELWHAIIADGAVWCFRHPAARLASVNIWNCAALPGKKSGHAHGASKFIFCIRNAKTA